MDESIAEKYAYPAFTPPIAPYNHNGNQGRRPIDSDQGIDKNPQHHREQEKKDPSQRTDHPLPAPCEVSSNTLFIKLRCRWIDEDGFDGTENAFLGVDPHQKEKIEKYGTCQSRHIPYGQANSASVKVYP